jgi:hypothetical protein
MQTLKTVLKLSVFTQQDANFKNGAETFGTTSDKKSKAIPATGHGGP